MVSGENNLRIDFLKQTFIWLNALIRRENLQAMAGSASRRWRRRPYLEMQIVLSDHKEVTTDFLATPGAERFVLVPFSEKYRQELLSLLNSIGSLGYWTSPRLNRDILATVASPEHDLILVSDGNSLCGLMALQTLGKNRAQIPELGFVGISPKHRGKGLADLLLSAVIKRSRYLGYSRIHLFTDGFRTAAIRCYLRNGFVPELSDARAEIRWRRILTSLPDQQNAIDNSTPKREIITAVNKPRG